jgi:hypothetical protein
LAASSKLDVEASRPVALGAHRAGANDDHIRKRPKNHKQAPVGRAAQRPGTAADRDGAVQARDHIHSHPRETTACEIPGWCVGLDEIDVVFGRRQQASHQ